MASTGKIIELLSSSTKWKPAFGWQIETFGFLGAALKKPNFVMTQFVNQGLVDELSNWTLPPVEAVEDGKKSV